MNWYKISQKQYRGRLYNKLMQLRPQFAAAAQKVYDEWDQNNEGIDDTLGSGGICQDIAEAIANVVSFSTNYNASTIEAQCGEQHVWAVVYNKTEAYHVDIHYGVYETGGGYNWKKKPDVKFDANMIEIYPADREIIDYIENDI